MFLDSSRYAKLATVVTTTAEGRTVTALTLRRLPPVAGADHLVTDTDRLDLLAFTVTGDGAQGWHIADANTALDAAGTLTAETGAVIQVPAT